jgi:hypothetical protein
MRWLLVVLLAVGCGSTTTTTTTTTSTSTSTTTTTSTTVRTTTTVPEEPVLDPASAEKALRERGIDPAYLSREIAEHMRRRFKPQE